MRTEDKTYPEKAGTPEEEEEGEYYLLKTNGLAAFSSKSSETFQDPRLAVSQELALEIVCSYETGGSQDPTTAIMVTLPLFLLFILLPCHKSQEDFLDQHQKWNYREGADKVSIEGVYSITQTLEKWGNDIFWQMKHTLLNNPNALLPEFSRVQMGPSHELPSLKSRVALKNLLMVACNSFIVKGPYPGRNKGHAVDNLVREVQSIRKRLEELNERLNVISKTVLPLRLNALQSQRRGNTQLRRLLTHRRRHKHFIRQPEVVYIEDYLKRKDDASLKLQRLVVGG
ncbi:hypothetical protein DUI87_20510 [Hirundo rustica rustica]|uniref:Uncharacterized protein n=1 Tax=Hirundo rustica rustica TaxID=333673 RepID=A0A3M0JRF2_HIRRU|nr:hypothetical protein DUI87_20510 [Hirundo rustica rustica]